MKELTKVELRQQLASSEAYLADARDGNALLRALIAETDMAYDALRDTANEEIARRDAHIAEQGRGIEILSSINEELRGIIGVFKGMGLVVVGAYNDLRSEYSEVGR